MGSLIRIASVFCVLIISSGCSNSVSSSKNGPQGGSPVPGASPVAGGCASTQVYRGPAPAWIDQATGQGTPEFPYGVTTPPIAAAFLDGYPLVAGHRLITEGRGNKILWAVTAPMAGDQGLDINVYPLGSSSPSVQLHLDRPPAVVRGRGGLYGSGIDVPTAGCWHFLLRAAGHTAGIDLNYVKS